jgi:gluconokinase
MRLQRTGGDAVVACSALKQHYRDQLAEGIADVRWVFLDAPPVVLATRLAAREAHFAGPELLESQLADLERPANAIVADARLPVPDIVRSVTRGLRR